MSKGRILVIGDVHGCAKGLEQVLERAKVTDADTIIQLGDVADGWSEVPECVDILLGLKNLISLRGNHDCWAHDWFTKASKHYTWTQQGGQATIDGYIRSGKLVDQHHRNFWKDQLDWYIDDQNRLFIHAGWDYTYKPGELEVGTISDRKLFELQAGKSVNSYGDNVLGDLAKECHWDRDILRGAKSGSIKNSTTGEPTGFRALNTFNEIYIGHTPSKNGLPHKYLNLWQMDTGAGWDGKLTILDIDTKEYWQSDFSMSLYPDEKGRHG